VAAAALIVAVAAVAWRAAPAQTPVRVQRLDLDLGRGFQAHPRSGQALLAPGGDRIVFSGVGANGAPELFLRRLDRTGTVSLDVGGAIDPFFSPDGRWLGFFRGDRLWKIDLSGGQPVELCGAPADTARGADWGDGGFIVAALDPAAGLVRIPEAGGPPVPLTILDESRREVLQAWPQVLPGSKAVIFTSHESSSQADGGTVEAVSLATGRRTTLQREGDFGRYLPSGHLVFVRRSTLFAAPMDAARLALTGPPVPVLGPVLVDEERGRLYLSASTTGDVLVLTGQWREAAGGAATLLVGFSHELRQLAPAGR
jgi:serine/threonine-protein kinase